MSTAALHVAKPLDHREANPTPSQQPERQRRFTSLPRLAPRRGPKLVHGVVGMAGLIAIVLAQLVMSMAISEGAYEVRALQLEQAQVQRTEQGLQEHLSALQSPQNLAMTAEALGMENGAQRQFIDLASGEVLVGADGVMTDMSALVERGSSLAVPNTLVMSDAELNTVSQESAIDAQRQREAEGYPGMLLPSEGVAAQD